MSLEFLKALEEEKDTICAISTPIGKGAIGIVRTSGNKSLEILKRVFLPFKYKKEFENLKTKEEKEKFLKDIYKNFSFEPRKMYLGYFLDENLDFIDKVLCVYFKAPNSYTGEDLIEYHSHGGLYITQKILKTLLNLGLRLAKPGEFTKRAVLSGKMDLLQAESLNAFINAKSEIEGKLLFSTLEGNLSKKIKEIQEDILKIKAYSNALVDFPEDEIEILNEYDFEGELKKIIEKIENLLKTYEISQKLKTGIKVAIIGKPNVGKSSLLNTLLKKERAIVTDIPGTTRDVLEEEIVLKGIPLVLIDTAGIRETQDIVEKIGIERSLKSLKEADIILFILDASKKIEKEDLKLFEILKKEKIPISKVIFLLNKIDIASKENVENIKGNLKKEFGEQINILEISVKEQKNIDKLLDLIEEKVLNIDITSLENETFIVSERQKEILNKVKDALNRALKNLLEYSSPEFFDLELEEALSYLGELIGKVTYEDMLDKIFSNFCIGK